MRRRRSFLAHIATAALAAAITASAFLLFDGSDTANDPQPAILIANQSAAPLTPSAVPPIEEPSSRDPVVMTRESVDWAAIYRKVAPALVSVVSNGGRGGAGSGFFVTTDGHLLTNLHVISGTDEVHIYLQDGSRLEAEVIAKDAGNDLALLKVDPTDIRITVPKFGNLDQLHVGDPVGALGAPFNLPNTLTVGIVSALDRTRRSGTGTWEPLRATIQTDAALNPGNSGGMLVDEHGRVVGIPTQIESPHGASSGIGFAVSAETILRSLPTMLQGKDVERGYLGLMSRETEDGLTVIDVVCGSAADRAGVRDGDRLIELNDKPAESLPQLAAEMSDIRPGDKITITVQRKFQRLTLQATTGSWPTSPPSLGCG